jgi:hypothetical protein
MKAFDHFRKLYDILLDYSLDVLSINNDDYL